MSNNNNQGTVSKVEPSPLAQINISVRGLVEFILREGDIDNRKKASSSPEVMLEGANIHRMIQRKMGNNYHAEYYLKHAIRRGEYEIVIDGRADGVIIPAEWEDYLLSGDSFSRKENTQDDFSEIENWLGKLLPDSVKNSKIIIDEIKSTYRDLEYMKEAKPVHLAQAKVYAYIFTVQNDLPYIGVRMTYVNSESYESRHFDSEYSREEICRWFDGIIDEYIKWADFQVNFKKIRNASIDAISFPYEYRQGQKELVAQVFNSIEKRGRLFVMAPTGVGKTLANVYPSLKAMSMGRADKIFYLTAKTITRTVASDCLNHLRQQSMRLKSIVLTAKEKICPLEKCECNPVACPYAKGHFDRINDAMYDLLVHEDDFSREKITEYANRYMVCPFEYTLDMSLFSDVVICDYNYVFDPNVYLRRFFAEGNTGEYLFLVDEAHNLVERGMKMYSACLSKEAFLEMKHLVRDIDPKLARSLEACNKYLLGLKRECEEVKLVDSFDSFTAHLLRLSARIEQFLDDNDSFEDSSSLLDFYFDIRHFLNIFDNMREEDYVSYTKLTEDGNFEAHLMCANPAGFIRKCTDKARFTVFFSATLLPITYYRKMLGADESDAAVYASSVFDKNNRCLLIARDVTSKYTRRTDAEYDKMAQYISLTVKSRPGNYMVFLPSFAMLERVYETYESRYFDSEKEILAMQYSQMSEVDREEFIGMFTTGQTEESLIGFCVLGGIFSEGLDLKNDSLIGAMIIGTGLPMVCAERQLLKRRYDEMGLNGFDYAYRFPGMNKVEQAAGRVIRTETDRGVVLLMDERFLSRDYLPLFPREWDNYRSCRLLDVAEELEEFWRTTL